MINIPFNKVESALFVRNRTYAKTAPRCKNCHEVQADHLDNGTCLFSPYAWVEGEPNIVVEEVPSNMEVKAYSNDIRKILSDNSVKDWTP